MVSRNVHVPSGQIEAFCLRWKIAELSLFGSVLRDDFRADSDVDVLVRFAPGADWSLSHRAQMQEELSTIMGRPADLVERQAVERSENYIRRRHILSSAEPVYVAR